MGSYVGFADQMYPEQAKRFIRASNEQFENDDPAPSLEKEGVEKASPPEDVIVIPDDPEEAAKKRQAYKKAEHLREVKKAKEASPTTRSKTAFATSPPKPPLKLKLKVGGTASSTTGQAKTEVQKQPEKGKPKEKQAKRNRPVIDSDEEQGQVERPPARAGAGVGGVSTSTDTAGIGTDDEPLVVVQPTSAPTSQPTPAPRAPATSADPVRQAMDDLTEVIHGHVMETDHMIARQRAAEFHGTGPLARLDALLEKTKASRVEAEARATAELAELNADPSIPESTVVFTEVTDEQAAAIEAEEAARNVPPPIPLEYHPQRAEAGTHVEKPLESSAEAGSEGQERRVAAEALLTMEAVTPRTTSAGVPATEAASAPSTAVAPIAPAPQGVPQTTVERERESTDEFVDAQTGSQPDVRATSEPPARETPEKPP